MSGLRFPPPRHIGRRSARAVFAGPLPVESCGGGPIRSTNPEKPALGWWMESRGSCPNQRTSIANETSANAFGSAYSIVDVRQIARACAQGRSVRCFMHTPSLRAGAIRGFSEV